jgi:hypothetical protein
LGVQDDEIEACDMTMLWSCMVARWRTQGMLNDQIGALDGLYRGHPMAYDRCPQV